MTNLKKIFCFSLIFFVCIGFLPCIKVQALTDINIISTTKVTAKEAKIWAKRRNATDTFVGLADLYWKYYKEHGNVNPTMAYVQAAIETGYGRFGVILDESYKNPCGMKTKQGGSNTDPNAHQRFDTWDDGVKAHLDHLALYAGASGYPRKNTTDPRHFSYVLGNAKTVQALSGTWASNKEYGNAIMNLYNSLIEVSNEVRILENLETKKVTSSGGTITIKGWAISKSSISSIQVYINDKFIGNATLGISRQDVKNAYPNYPNAERSGYSLSFDSSNLSIGTYKIKVIYEGSKGNSISSEGTLEIVKRQDSNNNEKKQVIVIDAGHGGTDSGACSGSRIEKTINLNIALKIEAELNSRGYIVKMVRKNDSTVSLKDRINFANNLNADLFISIHQNSFTNTLANGTEVYYTTSKPDSGFPTQTINKLSKSKEIAKLTCDNIVSAIGTYNRGIKDGDFLTLRNTKMPSILIECGFITNDSDALKTTKDSYQNKIAKAVAYAVSGKKYVEMNNDLNINSFNVDIASPQPTGTNVELKASASGGVGNIEYKFLLKTEDGNWYIIRDYSSSNTCIWKTGPIGNKTLYVDAKDSYGNIVRKSMDYKVINVSNPEITSFITDKASPQPSSTIVNLSASAKGIGELKYKFLLKTEDGNWHIIRDYSSSNTCIWKTGPIGNKTLYVDVKDSYGKVIRKSMDYKVINVSNPEITSFTADKASPQPSSTIVNLSASAKGTGELKYKFLLKTEDGNWHIIRDYDSSNTCTWKTGPIGNKTLYVDVKDSYGNVVRESINYKVIN